MGRVGTALVVILSGLLSAGAMVPLGAETDSPQASPVTYDSKGKRDPFVPLARDGRLIALIGETPSASGPLDTSRPWLGGIVWDSAGRSIALLDGKETMVGDTVKDYRVVEIHEDRVILEQEGRRVTLQITFEEPLTSESSSKP